MEVEWAQVDAGADVDMEQVKSGFLSDRAVGTRAPGVGEEL
jgi:hypothetical protein